MLKIGITGGIGTGKSEVSKILEKLGAKVFYADVIAKNLLDTEPVIKQKVKKVFGGDIYLPDGFIYRKKLAKLIFLDSQLKETLEKIVHPKVIDFIKNEFDLLEKSGNHKTAFIEAALIYEAKVDEILDYVIVVDAPEDMCIDRVMKRDSICREDVINRLKAQMNQNNKIKLSDFLIKNRDNLSRLELNVKFLYNLLNKMAGN